MKHVRIIITIISISVLFFSSIYSQQPTAEEIIERYISAIGGREAIERISNLRIEGAFVARSGENGKWLVNGSFEEIKTTNDLYGFLAKYNGNTSKIIVQPKRGVHFFPGANSDYFFGETDRHNFSTPFYSTTYLTLQSNTYLPEKEQYLIEEINRDSIKCNLFINAKSYLLEGITFEYNIKVLRKKLLFSYKFSDYKMFGTTRLPYRITKTINGIGTVDYFINKYDGSIVFNVDDFDNPVKSPFKLEAANSVSQSEKKDTTLISNENQIAVQNSFSRVLKSAELVSSQLVGKEVSDFIFNDIKGKQYSKIDLIGKITLIDLWATWCKPCVESLPFLATINNSFSHEKFQLWSISVDKQKATLESFLNSNKVPTWTMLHDPELLTKEIFKVDLYPVTILIDKKGIIREIYMGKGHEAETALKINLLIKDKEL
ncbi:MAG: alkyl hydroperoxide reductase [Stygiobacter sp.]|nr:MAG: alkyl hydroperoxide reductase [Stygiobacter sp.]KAF0214375.1 MAG: alkyl hydroperoxide [Ignavibacteria bacterium]